MGMIKCPSHGLTHITTCCAHLGDAVDANRFERASIVVDGSNMHHLLCERCLAQAANYLEESSNGGSLELDPPLVPYCHQHLMDWCAATGQGDLSEAIARAQARPKP